MCTSGRQWIGSGKYNAYLNASLFYSSLNIVPTGTEGNAHAPCLMSWKPRSRRGCSFSGEDSRLPIPSAVSFLEGVVSFLCPSVSSMVSKRAITEKISVQLKDISRQGRAERPHFPLCLQHGGGRSNNKKLSISQLLSAAYLLEFIGTVCCG